MTRNIFKSVRIGVTKALGMNSQMLCTLCSLSSGGKEDSKQLLTKEELERNTCKCKSICGSTSLAAKDGHCFNN